MDDGFRIRVNRLREGAFGEELHPGRRSRAGCTHKNSFECNGTRTSFTFLTVHRPSSRHARVFPDARDERTTTRTNERLDERRRVGRSTLRTARKTERAFSFGERARVFTNYVLTRGVSSRLSFRPPTVPQPFTPRTCPSPGASCSSAGCAGTWDPYPSATS